MLLKSHILPKNVRWGILVNQIQHISKQTTKPDATKVNCDYIGPVDPKTNLRQYVIHISPRETPTQRKLREMRTEVNEANQHFWQKHNESFYKEKDAFIAEQTLLNGDGEVPADKLSEFYKKFLDENHNRHVTYNLVWYKQNFKILLLTFQVELENMLQKLTLKK